MPVIPINEKPNYNTDQVANAISSNDMMDCITEVVPGVGAVTRRRPALKAFADLGTAAPGDGLYWWDAMSQMIAISAGRIFRVAQDGTSTDITGEELNVGAPVVFAAGTDHLQAPWLYMANGKLVYSVSGGATVAPSTIQTRTITPNRTAFASTTGGSWALSVGAYTDATYGVRITFKNNSTVGLSAITVTITGTDINGTALVEVLALPVGGGLATSAGWFKTVASIVPSAAVSTAAPTAISASVTGAIWVADNPTPSDGGAHKVTITNNTATDHSGKTVTVTGLSATGLSINDIFSLPAASLSVTSATSFAKIASVVPSATIGADTMSLGWIGQTVDVGWSADAQQLGSDDTPAATHVAWIDEKFVANDSGTNQFKSTDFNDNTGFMDNAFWAGASNPTVCSAKGQNLTSLMVAWQQIYAWGNLGSQILQDDGVTPFVNIPGAFIEAGLEAPYSVLRGNNAIFALCVIDGKRVVVQLVGSTPKVISEPIARVLAEMPTVSDAIGDLISVGGLAIYLLQFPTAGQTWAYDYLHDEWFRWGSWSDGDHANFLGCHACFAKGWNKHLIMSRVDGKIYELDRNTFTDAGSEIVSYRRTGHIDHGMIFSRKRSNQLSIKVKVFAHQDGTITPTLLFRWRDDGRPNWSKYMELPLDTDSQGGALILLNRMGIYRMRQYEFRISDNVDLALVAATEDLTELRN